MALVLFINEDTLKDYTILSDNIDFKQLRPEIIAIQDIYILPLLGTGLYDQLKSEITASSVSAHNQTLLDTYIQPTLIWHIMAYSPIALNFKYTNKGIGQKNTESMNGATLDDMANILGEYQKRAEYYAERLTNYLVEKSPSLFPLYLNPGSGVDTVYPKRTGYSSQISLAGYDGRPLTMEQRWQGNYDLYCDSCYSYYGKF